MPDAAAASGRCLCGAVRFRAAGAPLFVAFCHCESCRRATGGALVAWAGFPRDGVAFEGELRCHASSPGVRRGFCPACGSSLTFESERWPGEIHLVATQFDEPAKLSPTSHVFAAERLPWLHLADGLPRYRTTASAGDGLE